MKLFNFLFLFGVAFLASCAAPSAVKTRVESDFGQNQVCRDLFLDGAIANTYQTFANDPFDKAVFAVGRDSSGNVRVCAWGVGRSGNKWATATNKAIEGCERARLSFMEKNSIELSSCKVYARDNEIL